MMSCEYVSRLSSEKMERRLNLKEQFALQMHTTICKGCLHFTKQMDELRQIARIYRQQGDTDVHDRKK